MKKTILPGLFVVLLVTSCFNAPSREVMVTGVGTVYAVPDTVSLNLTFRELGKTTLEARNRVNSKVLEALDLLVKSGVDQEKIKTTSLNYGTKTAWESGKSIVLGQEATQTLSISLLLGEGGPDFNILIDQLTEIDGLEMGQLVFSVSDYTSYKEEARRLAYESGHSKASAYASLAGLSLKNPILISEGVEPVSYGTTRMDVLYEAKSEAPVGSQVQVGQNAVSITVKLIFELQ